MVVLKILFRSHAVQGVMRSNGVVDTLPCQVRLVQGADLEISVVEFVELLGMGPLSPLCVSVELGRAVRQYEQSDPHLLTRHLELRLELAAPVHSHCLYGEGEPLPHRFKELGWQGYGGPAVYLHNGAPGHHVSSGEVFQCHP